MKLRATTPVSLSLHAKRAFIILTAFVLVVAGIAYTQRPASADQYDDKISALQADMARYQAESDRLNAEANTLSNALAQITNEKNALQAQIDVSQAQYDKLVIQIADTEKQIKDNQDALGTTIADLYVDDSISPVEMLASSQNISEYLNKQEYRNSVKDQLSSTIKKVKDLKVQLSAQKDQVTSVLATQKTSRDELASKEAAQASLLAQTQNNEATYQNMVNSSAAQIADARAAQAALRARSNATGGYTLVDAGSLSAYPWNSSNCPMGAYLPGYGWAAWASTEGSDGNGQDGHQYGCRQCVSYVAWRVAKETGIYYNKVLGNGGDTAGILAGMGYQNLGGVPQPNSVASLWGDPGHTAYVEDVSADGSKILVSQYNYDYGAGYGMYSKMWLSSHFFNQYVKIK